MTETTNEILLFQVGARIFATEVYDVHRIGSSGEVGVTHVTRSCLGRPFSIGRGLVVGASDDGEHSLAVDQVLGIRKVPGSEILPLPALAAQCLGSAAVVGIVFLDDSPTPLIDIPTLIREQLQSDVAARERSPNA